MLTSNFKAYETETYYITNNLDGRSYVVAYIL